MTASMTPYASVCRVTDIPEGLGRAFRVGDRKVAVFRSRTGRVFALDQVCPHRQGPLADGMLLGDRVVCPLHAFRFDGNTGSCDQPGVCAVARYPVEVVDGEVRVGVVPA